MEVTTDTTGNSCGVSAHEEIKEIREIREKGGDSRWLLTVENVKNSIKLWDSLSIKYKRATVYTS